MEELTNNEVISLLLLALPRAPFSLEQLEQLEHVSSAIRRGISKLPDPEPQSELQLSREVGAYKHAQTRRVCEKAKPKNPPSPCQRC